MLRNCTVKAVAQATAQLNSHLTKGGLIMDMQKNTRCKVCDAPLSSKESLYCGNCVCLISAQYVRLLTDRFIATPVRTKLAWGRSTCA